MSGSATPRSPLQMLEPLAVEEAWVGDDLRHIEVYTMGGLLTMLWHGDPAAPNVVVTAGGGMGSLLGPADALYQWLGTDLDAGVGGGGGTAIGVIRVGYRKPNDLGRCMLDVAAAADLAAQNGARRFVTLGHSFGGAVAVQAGIVLGRRCAGVVTLATQSAGCEDAGALRAPLLLMHGDADEILPAQTSAVVAALAGQGEVVILEGDGHLLRASALEIRTKLAEWIPARLRDHAAAAGDDR